MFWDVIKKGFMEKQLYSVKRFNLSVSWRHERDAVGEMDIACAKGGPDRGPWPPKATYIMVNYDFFKRLATMLFEYQQVLLGNFSSNSCRPLI